MEIAYKKQIQDCNIRENHNPGISFSCYYFGDH